MSRFLTDDDYKSFITDYDLNAMLEEHEGAEPNPKTELLKCETIAQDEIASYLRNRYDIEKVFAPGPSDEDPEADDERSPVIVMYMIDVALFHLASRLPGRMSMEQRQQRYDLALEWLDRVNKGRVQPALPLIDEETDPGNPVKWGSTPKQRFSW